MPACAGVDRDAFRRAVEHGRTDTVLHAIEAQAGQAILIPAGTVHAIGGGLLVLEVQQASDTTYRLFDWNRIGTDGRPRPLHVESGMEVIDFERGPVKPAVPEPLPDGGQRLIGSRHFIVDRYHSPRPTEVPDDGRLHVVAAVAGALEVLWNSSRQLLRRGACLVLPARRPGCRIVPQASASWLDIRLPDEPP